MIRLLKLLIVLPVVLLTGCEQTNFLCKSEVDKIKSLEKRLAITSLPEKNTDTEMMRQLEQVTLELVQVKIQRDLFKQELAAYRKRDINK